MGDVRPVERRTDMAGRAGEADGREGAGPGPRGSPVSALGALLSRHPAAGRNAGLRAQIVLAAVCAGYAVGAAVGWGSPGVALFMGDFGLSVAALVAAVSCFLYARVGGGRLRPAWLLFSLSSAMAAGGNAVWGWYEVVLGREVPSPPSRTSSSSASLRPPSSGCWSWPNGP